MSDKTDNSNSNVYYSSLSTSKDDLLERYYHCITRLIRPHLFYPYLRQKSVLTHCDQEEIDNRFITTVLKAGHLVDIVKTKGWNGFVAFMEVIEYEYPELFTMVTSLEPRPPPPNFFPRSGDSFRIHCRIGTSIKIAHEVLANKAHMTQLQRLLEEMQSERQREDEEQNRLCNELRDKRETIERLEADNSRLLQDLEKTRREMERLMSECSELRTQKDNFMDECNRLRRSSLTEMLDGNTNVSTTPTSLRPNTSSSNEEMNSLKSEVGSFGVDEVKTLREKLKEVESKLIASQQTSDLCLVNVQQVKTERNKILDQYNDMKKQHDKEVSKNEQLTKECQQYLDRFRRMEETMGNLYKEIDQLRLLDPNPNTDRWRPQVPPQRRELPTDARHHNTAFFHKTPFVLVGHPESIVEPVFKYLLQHYCDTCPYDEVSPEESSHMNAIHEISSDDDKTCKLLTVDSLKAFVRRPRVRPVLLAVPRSCIKAINMADLKVIVLDVRTKNTDGRPQSLSAEDEELIEACPPQGNEYKSIDIDSSLSNDVAALGELLRQHIDKIIAGPSKPLTPTHH
jgi:hypothetical protein